MYTGKYVFSQILEFIDDRQLKKCTDIYTSENRIRTMSSTQQFRAMLFGQLAYRESLRDIVTCLGAHKEKTYHFGFRFAIKRSTLSDANNNRDWRIYRDLAMLLIKKVRSLGLVSREIPGLDLASTVYLLDSTVIDLCLNIFSWAKFDTRHSAVKLNMQLDLDGSIPAFFTITKGLVNDINFLDEITYEAKAYYVMDKGYLGYERWYKIHQAGAYFVTRARSNMRFTRLYSNVVDKDLDVLCDQVITLSDIKSRAKYPAKIRRIKYRDGETNKVYVFLANDFNSPALTIAILYKNRWQVELFFRWIKQHLKIKSFWGTSENAVKTQICIALCSYLIIALIKKKLDIKLDLYQMLQITSVSLFDKKPLKSLFCDDDLLINVKGGQELLDLQWL